MKPAAHTVVAPERHRAFAGKRALVMGLGSFGGAVISGLLVGVSVALSIQFWPAASTAVMYALMILILLIRPRGLLGESWERFE